MEAGVQVPQHVALILDGNGRWAASQGKPRTYGHMMGAKRVEPICRHADRRGVRYLSLYAFSTENWKRPKAEVAALMKLLEQYMGICKRLAMENNMRAKIIGDKAGLPDGLQRAGADLEDTTAGNTGLTLLICINYGSRDEMLRGIRRLSGDVRDGKLDLEGISEAVFSSYLDTAGIPDPDLLIRTSGEQRLSNYFLWQMAYAELYFTDVPWPAFDEAEFDKALEAYANRERRYGKL